MSNEKILIIYGSWLKSTQQVAERIADVFKAEGAARVDVLTGREVKEVTSYDAVVLGSAVRAMMLPGRFRRPVKKFSRDLKGKPMAGFVVCAAMFDETIENREEQSSAYLTKFTDPISEVKLLDVTAFKGAFLDENAGSLFKKIVQSMGEKSGKDHREWDVIENWARETYGKLTA